MEATRSLWLVTVCAVLAGNACGGRASDHGGVSTAGTSAAGSNSGGGSAGACSACDGGKCVNDQCCSDPNGIAQLDGTPCATAGDYCSPSGCGDACWCQERGTAAASPIWMCGPTLCVE